MDNYQTNDATVLSEHITESGIVDMAYQQSPYNILWCVRDDGKLAVFTKQIEQKIAAWTLHDTQGYYESVAVIPKTSYDEVWFVVRRTIGGETKRYIEYMVAPTFEDQEDAFFVHSGLMLDSPIDITAVTKTDPIVVSAPSHGLSNGDRIKIRNVVGMTELNWNTYLVADKTDDSFELTNLGGTDIDSTDYGEYESGGEVRKCVNSVSGLNHLEGKTVQVLVDGATHPNRIVSDGEISLDGYYSQVIVGLGYTARLKTNDLEAMPGGVTSRGKKKKVFNVAVNFFETVGCKIGDDDTMDDIIFRDSSMPTDRAIPLFTGLKMIDFPNGWSRTKHIVCEQEDPLPFHILNIVAEIEVN